jgi:hypothetical protein
MAQCSYDCREIPGPLEENADVSGLGVALGFTISVWISILVLVLYYILAYDPTVDSLAVRTRKNMSPNPVDVLFFRTTLPLRSWIGGRAFDRTRLEAAFNKVRGCISTD